MLKTILKVKRIRGDVRALFRGPQALGKRLTERAVHRFVHKLFR